MPIDGDKPVSAAAHKEIAWNGIQFSHPGAWQIAALGDNHIMLEGARGPTMEIIWRRINGRFSHKTHLKRMAAHFPGKTAVTVRTWPPPPDWLAAVSGFDAAGFEWGRSAERGRGMLLYCKSCRRASLVHFFVHHLDAAGTTIPHILSGFRDHHAEGGRKWRVFDVSAILPAPFELDRHRLEAGRFELVFAHRQNRIVLHRWALAEMVLKNKGLAEFGQEMKLVDARAAREVTVDGYKGIEQRREAVGTEAWMRWLSAKPAHHWCRLWHVEPRNRILGVVAETRRPMNTELFERICRHYETF